MADTSPVPYSPPPDLVSLQAASQLFKETGHPATVRTLKRRAVAAKVVIVRAGSADHASFTDLLKLHAQMYPPPA